MEGDRVKSFGGAALGASIGLLLGFGADAVLSYLYRGDPNDQGWAFLFTSLLGLLLGAILGGIWARTRR
jgi:hypothetical protein